MLAIDMSAMGVGIRSNEKKVRKETYRNRITANWYQYDNYYYLKIA